MSDWQPAHRPAAHSPDHPRATTALVLGILGLVVCGVAAPLAWATGRRALAEIDASQGRLGGRWMAQAGYVLGVIGTFLLGVALLMAAGVVLFTIASQR